MDKNNKKNPNDSSIKLNENILEDIEVNIEKEEKKYDDFFDYDKSILEFKPIGIVDELYDKSKKNQVSRKKNEIKNDDFHENISKDENASKVNHKQENTTINQDKITINSIEQNETSRDEFAQLNNLEDNNHTSNDNEEIVFEEKTNNEKDYEYDEIKIKSLIESALYVYGNEGISLNDLKKLTLAPTGIIKKILKKWIEDLENDDSKGISIKNYGERYKFFTKANNREELSRLITIKYKNPLSTKVMETLAIIAYNQPCTKIIIENIRGKDPTATIQKLVDLGLVNNAGRGDGPGHPLLFTVSHKFYDIFGIKNVSDLPIINLEQPFQDDDVSFFDTTRYNN